MSSGGDGFGAPTLHGSARPQPTVAVPTHDPERDSVRDPGRSSQRDDDWSPAGPVAAPHWANDVDEHRRSERRPRVPTQAPEPQRFDAGYPDAVRPDPREASSAGPAVQPRGPRERGLPGWAALLVVVVLTGFTLVLDAISGSTDHIAFNYGLPVACVVGILIVRRSIMFPIVIAPPLLYLGGSLVRLFFQAGDGSKRKLLIDAASNWLVYGFPTIGIATALVLVIAVLRFLVKR